MNVTLIAYTQAVNPEKVKPEMIAGVAAKTCYSANTPTDLLDTVTEESSVKTLKRITKSGHESPIEHLNFTFAIEGVSRSLLAQITRHRLASYSVQSQRYVNQSDAIYDMVRPDTFRDKNYVGSVDYALYDISTLYESMIKDGVPQEDARFILPEGMKTNIVLTMNARELKAFFRLRCCNRAQWEIRQVAYEMLKQVYPIAPTIFEDAGASCVGGFCPEGKMTCKQAQAVRESTEKMKKEAIEE